MDSLERLHRLKLNLGVKADTDDSLLSYLLDSLTVKVKRYCRRHEIPDDLEYVIIDMATARWRSQNIGSDEAATAVSSVTDGDQTVHFASLISSDDMAAMPAGLTQAEMIILNEWRRLYW